MFTAGTLATAALPGFAAVLAGRAVAGLGGAMITPTAVATAAALVPVLARIAEGLGRIGSP